MFKHLIRRIINKPEAQEVLNFTFTSNNRLVMRCDICNTTEEETGQFLIEHEDDDHPYPNWLAKTVMTKFAEKHSHKGGA